MWRAKITNTNSDFKKLTQMVSVTEQELEAALASARARDIRASRRQEDVVVSHTERMLDESTFL